MKKIIAITVMLMTLSLASFSKADCYNGYECLGTINAFAIIPTYGGYTCGVLPITLFRDCYGEGRLWVRNGTSYSMVVHNSRSTFMGYDVSQYRYKVDANNCDYFFN